LGHILRGYNEVVIDSETIFEGLVGTVLYGPNADWFLEQHRCGEGYVEAHLEGRETDVPNTWRDAVHWKDPQLVKREEQINLLSVLRMGVDCDHIELIDLLHCCIFCDPQSFHRVPFLFFVPFVAFVCLAVSAECSKDHVKTVVDWIVT
jgi:hypothetical protein